MLAKAFTELGKLIKTVYLLRYIGDKEVRRRVQKQLCHGEQRHGLAGHVFFANHGVFKTGDLEEIMSKANCMSLLSNAIVVWNTVHIDRIIRELRQKGHEISQEHLSGVTPFIFDHIIVNGTYDFSN